LTSSSSHMQDFAARREAARAWRFPGATGQGVGARRSRNTPLARGNWDRWTRPRRRTPPSMREGPGGGARRAHIHRTPHIPPFSPLGRTVAAHRRAQKNKAPLVLDGLLCWF
jgi:hypothetical protein